MRSATPRALWVLLSLFVALALISSVVVPPFETPDEIWHYAFIQHVAEGKGLPHSEPNTEALWRQQGGQAPGYYLLAVALTAWVDQSDFPTLYQRSNPHAAIGQPDLPNKSFFLHYPSDGWPWHSALLALHLARLLSIALGAVTLWATFQCLRLIRSDDEALWATALVALIPQVLFIAGAASNDNAINAAAALLLWRLMLLLETPVLPDDRRPFVVMGLLLGAALLAKISGAWLILVTAGTLVVQGWRHRRPRWAGRALVITLGTAMVVAGWWFARNMWLYGDLGASEIWRSNILLRPTPASLATIAGEWEGLHHSFWGLFGWFNVPYPLWLYRSFEVLSLLMGAGLIVWLGRWWQRGHPLRPSVILLLLWPLLLGISWVAFMRIAPAAQGRYFHPALPSLALLMSTGLSAWPVVPRAWLIRAVVVALGIISALTPWLVIRPAYAPSAPLVALPPSATPSDARYGSLLRLVGYDLPPLILANRPTVPVTLYWQALEPLPEDYSVSVKLLDVNGDVLASSDSMPDAGRWPMTQLPTTEIVADSHELQLLAPLTEPSAGRLVVEVYPFDSPLATLPTRLGDTEADLLPGVWVPLRASSLQMEEKEDTFTIVAPRVELEGDRLEVTFEWDVGRPLAQEYQMFVHLVGEPSAPPVAQYDGPPLQGRFPTRFWLAGDRLTERVSLPLPPTAAERRYTLVAGLYDLATGSRLSGAAGQSDWKLATLRWDGEAWHVEP